MKRIFLTFFFVSAAILSPVAAKDFCPFKFNGRYNHITESSLKITGYSHQDMDFTQWRVEGSYSQPVCDNWGVRALGGYEATRINWEGNPFFSETDFAYLFGGLGGFWYAWPAMTFTANASVNVDTQNSDSKYMSLEWTTVAKYRYCCQYPFDVDLYFGLWGDAGHEDIELLPIIGIDLINEGRCHFKAIFPMDISVGYYVTKQLLLSADARLFYSRHRLDKSETISEGIIKYKNVGTELALTYEPSSAFFANIHIGWAFEGDLKIADKHGRNSSHYKTDGAMYFGATGSFAF